MSFLLRSSDWCTLLLDFSPSGTPSASQFQCHIISQGPRSILSVVPVCRGRGIRGTRLPRNSFHVAGKQLSLRNSCHRTATAACSLQGVTLSQVAEHLEAPQRVLGLLSSSHALRTERRSHGSLWRGLGAFTAGNGANRKALLSTTKQ